jgi:hypothetical protein
VSIWNWLFGRSQPASSPDKFWVSNNAALSGLAKQVREDLPNNDLLIVASHFPGRLEEIRERFDSESIPVRLIDRPIRASLIDREFDRGADRVVTLALTNSLVRDVQSPAVDPSHKVRILVRERHLLRSFDQHVEGFAAGLPCSASLEFFVSMDDALLQMFTDASVRDLLRRMGMKEDEVLSSSLIGRRLKGAQDRVQERYEKWGGERADGELQQFLSSHAPCASAEEWLAKHQFIMST